MKGTFKPLKNGSVWSRIVDELRAAVYSGRLKPGAPLLELQLARDFQVSQTSVREALLHLERLGIVQRVANRGTFVTKLSPDEVRERLEVRIQLEYMAAVRAGSRMTTEFSAELQNLVEAISGAILRNDYFESAQADLDFHRTIWKIAGNDTLFQLLDQLTAPLFAFVSILRKNRLDDLKHRIHSHQEYMNALESGDAAAICKAVECHFRDSYEQFYADDAAEAISRSRLESET
jgi:DNA-binding GntR family transcriptional regulator